MRSINVEGVIDTLLMAKEMFPGKRQQPDALCDRLDVDRWGEPCTVRCWMRNCWPMCTSTLTRGQDALIMDVATPEVQAVTSVKMDMSGIDLPALVANVQELAAHDDVLTQIDKSSGARPSGARSRPRHRVNLSL